MIEQEVKLEFPHVEAARQAIISAGGRLVVSRRLLEDRLFDSADSRLRNSGITLRTRRDGNQAYVTFKGRVQPGPVKAREELETLVGDVETLEAALSGLGFHEIFRAQKYRAEYDLDDAHVTIDEAPFGVFVEIESTPAGIEHVSRLLGRTPRDYRLESYPTLWHQWCEEHGLSERDMIFDSPPAE